MPSPAAYLAVDLGAESGRALLGRFDGERVALEELHRFPNAPVRLPHGLHWDALRLYSETITALGKAGVVAGPTLESAGVDAWGVDFALLDRAGALLGNPHHYRDLRTEGMPARAAALVPPEEIYARTGIQTMPINTLFQLLAMAAADSPQLRAADTLLLIPDLLNYWFTGETAAEVTIASTTQLLDATTRAWAGDLIERFGLPPGLFPAPVPPGTALGPLLPHVAEESGLGRLPIAAVASHDTASAVAAVPASTDAFAYVSSGTWSLVGLETGRPVLSAEARDANLTNEAGLAGTTRLLKNVMGLWLVQECRRAWAHAGHEYSYDDLTALAEVAPPFGPVIDPDHPSLLPPGDMPTRLRARCAATGQPIPAPADPGALVRCALESLALKTARVLTTLERVADRPVDVIHVVGGGSRNALLCQLTADAARRPVLAGPVEATALGNVLVQALTSGRLASPADLRAVVRRSVEVTRYEPSGNADRWEEAAAHLERVAGMR